MKRLTSAPISRSASAFLSSSAKNMTYLYTAAIFSGKTEAGLAAKVSVPVKKWQKTALLGSYFWTPSTRAKPKRLAALTFFKLWCAKCPESLHRRLLLTFSTSTLTRPPTLSGMQVSERRDNLGLQSASESHAYS
jgi:hypothetical protein